MILLCKDNKEKSVTFSLKFSYISARTIQLFMFKINEFEGERHEAETENSTLKCTGI